MMEVVVTTGAVRHAKLSLIITPNKLSAFYGLDVFLVAQPTQQCQSTEGKSYLIPQTCSPQGHLTVFQPYLT